MLLPHIFLTPPIEVYTGTNVRQNFVLTNFLAIFCIKSHTPLSLSLSLVWQHIHQKIKPFVCHYISMPR